jgi:hypothetical protein
MWKQEIQNMIDVTNEAFAFKVIPQRDAGKPRLIVSWDQYRHMVKIGMVKRKEALEFLSAEEVDTLSPSQLKVVK